MLADALPQPGPPISLYPGYGTGNADVDEFPGGGFVASWFRDIPEPWQVVARHVAGSGEPSGELIVVSEPEPYAPTFPIVTRVATLGDDRFVVVWNGWNEDSSGWGVRARLFTRDGVALGESFLVNQYEPGDQVEPDLGSDLRGRFVVAWQSDGQDGFAGGIYARLFDRDGVALSDEIRVSSEAATDQWGPSVAMDTAGRFVVAFMSFYEPGNFGEDVFLRAYGRDGAPLGSQVVANEQILFQQEWPQVDVTDGGVVAATWTSWQLDGPFDPGGENNPSLDVMLRLFVLPCTPDDWTLCLEGGRFQVRAFWRIADGSNGVGHSIPFTADTGGFWFFGPENFELLVKVLDGCGVNGNFWIYAAGLTDVAVDLLVSDTWTGRAELFENVLGEEFVPIQEVGRLPVCGAENPHAALAPPPAPQAAAGAEVVASSSIGAFPLATASAAAGGCGSDPARLCLGGGRFEVRAEWAAFDGSSGSATAVPLSEESGLFWFFWQENLELAVKVLDGCSINSRYWVFAAGLTNVEVELTVTDTSTGFEWTLRNPSGEPFRPVIDVEALPVCP
ncbi:MAG: hypothetical protein KDB94_03175 [Acidobacteria bacterium]|nr:hypothetical protein [Acidobacteriota bacterium]MCB9378755.1 hypothetical protein [Holophagales bacterium]